MPRSSSLRSLFELIRLPNTLTAAADVMAGAALFGRSPLAPEVLLAALGSMALYGGGIALNDRLDVEKDRSEAPHRVLPRAALSVGTATRAAVLLMGLGLMTAIGMGTPHLLVTAGLVLAIIGYDVWPEGARIGAPVLMGLCRALNLARGATLGAAVAVRPTSHAAIIVHLGMVIAITVVSTFEGQSQLGRTFRFAVFGLIAAYALPVLVSLDQGTTILGLPALLPIALLSSLLAAFIAQPGLQEQPRPIRVVLRAVFALILYDTLLVMASGYFLEGLVVLALFPASRFLARWIGQKGS